MKKLFKYFRSYIKETILAPLFKLLEALLELFIPLVVASIIDNGIGLSDKSYVIKMIIVMISCGIVGLILSVLGQFFAAKTAVGFCTKLTTPSEICLLILVLGVFFSSSNACKYFL